MTSERKEPLNAPEGERYAALVPDTLDLAERARLAINGLTGSLDVEHEYEMYFLVRYTADPPYMMHMCMGDLSPCTPKFAESLPLMRAMSGSAQNLETEQNLMEALVGLIAGDGLFYVPAVNVEETPWRRRGDYPIAEEDAASAYGNARLMLAMMAWYQRDRDPVWLARLQKMADGLGKIAVCKDDYAFYPEGKVGMEFTYLKESGYAYAEEPQSDHEGAEGCVNAYQGAIRALVRWYAMSGDDKALDLAGRLVRFVTKPKMWGADAESKWVVGPEHGHFSYHFHGNHIVLRGILEYAHITNDQRLKEFVRDGYEWARSWGMGRIGCFGCGCWGAHTEGCSIGDMVALAIRLTDYGVGDYWDDVDQYVRNHLVEQQLVQADLLEKVSKASVQYPEAHRDFPDQPRGFAWDPPHWEATLAQTKQDPVSDGVIERTLGLFAGFGDPTTLPYPVSCGCCSGNGTQGLYYAWESIVRYAGGVTRVNLLLNRASPWLDIDSYLPYEGKVVIRNKAAQKLTVRIPRWVDKGAVSCELGGKRASPLWLNNYLILEMISPGDVVTIRFPMEEETVKYTHVFDKEYTCYFKGNTLVDIRPRDTNPTGYPIYLRDHYRGDQAPMKPIDRYVAPFTVRW